MNEQQNSKFCIPRLDMQDMAQFYEQKRHLAVVNAVPLLQQCISSSYTPSPRTHYDHWNSENSWVEYFPTVTYISTNMLINKFDSSLYMWRELNPTLVQLLSQASTCDIDVIANWVRGVNYYAPIELIEQANSSGDICLLEK